LQIMHHGKTVEPTGCRSSVTRHAAADLNCGGANSEKVLAATTNTEDKTVWY